MSIPAFSGLETALSGLEASQVGLDVTGNNIANADTLGYTRETPDFGESDALALNDSYDNASGGVQLGTGVDVDSIQRIRDDFLDIQYRAQNASSSNAQTLAAQLGDAQNAIDPGGSDTIANDLSSFWSAWGSLADAPAGSATATAESSVIAAGQQLAGDFNSVDQQLSTLQSQAQSEYATLTGSGGQVSQLANQIASLNQQISEATQDGQSPNQLLDERDEALDQLSSLGQVSVTAQSDGTDTVTFGDAASPLVSGSTVTWPQTLTSATGGQLGALLSLTSSTGPIGSLRTALSSVATDVATEVNALQPSSTPFFSIDASNPAGSISVVATASTITASSPGGTAGDIAQQIANLQGGTADQAYATFIGEVGTSVSSADSTASTASAVLAATSNQRQSVSGVSLDEEMSNLITYQQAYEASARVMNTMDSVLSTLINSTGATGV